MIVRPVEIERLVQWAYRDELPKRGIGDVANSWEPVIAFGELLTRVDDEPGFPVFMGAPHVDALTIERAVQGLADEVTIDWRACRAQLMGDLPMLAAHVEDPFVIAPADERGRDVVLVGGNSARVARSGAARLRVFSQVALVEQYARLGRRPVWDVGVPTPSRILGKNNRPVLNGESKGDGRYSPGACCPLQYTAPTIEQMVFRRAEYLVWREGLVRLAGILRAWLLRDHAPLDPVAPPDPWFDAPPEAPLAAVPGVAPAWRVFPNEPIARKKRQRAPKAEVPHDA